MSSLLQQRHHQQQQYYNRIAGRDASLAIFSAGSAAIY
jgi:hypothetical protein